ncbi:MAG: type II secretion system protein [Phycisphaerales bacterium]
MTGARRGFSMMEVVLSIMLVGVVLVASMNTLAGAKAASAQLNERSTGAVLCESMMSEILSQRYADASDGETSFGKRLAEVGDGSRKLFDDVDDYDGWASTPPEERDGSPIAWATGLTRSVTVECVRPSDFSGTSPDGACLKLVRVTVKRKARVVYELEAYASPLWPDPRAEESE